MVSLHTFFILITVQNTQSESISCNSSCNCDQDELCELQCIGDQACKGSNNILTCRPNHQCYVICDTSNTNGAKSACDSATILANGAYNLTVFCLGHKACTNTIIDCNDTDYCSIFCHNEYNTKASCEATQLDCSTSNKCNLDCDSTKACDSMIINTYNTESFECHDICDADGIPPSFTRTSSTSHPITTYFDSSSTTINNISTFTLNTNTSKRTAIHEQEVVDKTTDFEYMESEEDVQSVEETSILKNKIWLYPAIAAAGCLCICALIIVLLRCRQKKVSKPNTSKLQPIIHLSNNCKSVATQSQTVTPVTTQSAATPSTYNVNLNVIKDSMHQSFSEYLESGALASSLAMNDIVDNMVSTPGAHAIWMNMQENEVMGEEDDDVDDIIIDDEHQTTVQDGEIDEACENRDDDIIADVNQMTGIQIGENDIIQ